MIPDQVALDSETMELLPVVLYDVYSSPALCCSSRGKVRRQFKYSYNLLFLNISCSISKTSDFLPSFSSI